MISLDFEITEPKPLNQMKAEAIFALARVTLFEGTQKLIVNDTDFSSEVPLFWAGHQLREMVQSFKKGLSYQFQFNPMNGSPELTFSLKDGAVSIAGLAIIPGAEMEHCEAVVSLLDLEDAVKLYSRKVYKKLSKLYPILQGDYFRDWFYGEHEGCSEPTRLA